MGLRMFKMTKISGSLTLMATSLAMIKTVKRSRPLSQARLHSRRLRTQRTGRSAITSLVSQLKPSTNCSCCSGRSLGSGTFGKVRIGTHTITGEKVAIKILEKDRIKDKGDVERVTREINILKKVRHPNVIQLYEVRNYQIMKLT